VKATEHWRKFPRDIVESSSKILKRHLDMVLDNWL